jgi:hypothetical protein
MIVKRSYIVRCVVAKSQQNIEVESNDDEMVTITVPRRFLRFIPVEPSEFARVKTELGMSNKNVAEAIGRTLSRVSELTNSKGASQLVFDQYVAALTAWRESHPATEQKS